MRNHYKSSKGRFRSLLRQHKREERENLFASLDLHNTDPWKLFRTIRQKNGHRMVPTTQLVSRGKTYEGHEVMDGWKTHFQDLASPTSSPSFDDTFHTTIIAEFQHLLTIPPGEDITVSPSEVARAVESLASNKAAVCPLHGVILKAIRAGVGRVWLARLVAALPVSRARIHSPQAN